MSFRINPTKVASGVYQPGVNVWLWLWFEEVTGALSACCEIMCILMTFSLRKGDVYIISNFV